ncbi:hypothetical protein M23134_06052 [Microscilla marina ATCC 23134]|uniref:Lipoprotein n=2 Tax=Microscilla marina TaxID=1027 RepID=A1ZWY4_MICM2|nr:hypothetical protein M23134_06052 [Microscilla marina ATCC 23134]
MGELSKIKTSIFRYLYLFTNQKNTMKNHRLYCFIASLCLLSFYSQAQEYTKKVLNKVPELEVGKTYTGKDVRQAQKLFPEGAAIGDKVVYPFAKLTGKRAIVIFYYTADQGGEIIYLSATALHKKKLQPTNIQRYLYTHGKINKTVYTSTLSRDKKGVVSFHEVENGQQKTTRYRIEGRRFSIVRN